MPIDPNSPVGHLISDRPSGAVVPAGPVKPGKWTTEFLAVLILIVPAVVTEVAAFVDENRAASPLALVGGGIAVAGYAIARALIKRGAL